MSLSVDGVWKTGVWDQTVWADGVWREGSYAPPAPATVSTGGGTSGKKKKKSRGTVIRWSDFETRDAYASAVEKAAKELAESSIPLDAVSTDGEVDEDILRDDEIILMTIARILH